MKAKRIVLFLVAGVVLVFFGYILVGGITSKSGYGALPGRGAREVQRPARTCSKDQLPANHSGPRTATAEMPPSREIVSQKWKGKERLLDEDKSRPASYQKSLEEPVPADLKFGASVRLSLVDHGEAGRLEYPNDNLSQKVVTVDGRQVNELQYVYGQHGNMKILGFPYHTEASRVIKMKNQTEGETVAILPRFNYHERRRWYIDGWAWLSDNELLGLSHEEDGKSEGIAKSHFYSYDMDTKTLRTLVPPDEVDAYQALDFHGMNPETKTMKISDEAGNVFYLRYDKPGG